MSFHEVFPPAEDADENGLVLVGGELSPESVLEAYRQAIFPWPVDIEGRSILAWWSPDPRAILESDSLICNRRLLRRIRSEKYRITMNEAFQQVIAGCAAPREGEPISWITTEMEVVYTDLHQTGNAHSIEVWQGEKLVGGIYGIAIGAYFSAESMFYRERDASKIALAYLIGHLSKRGYTLIDFQEINSHTESMGASAIPRAIFLKRHAAAIASPILFGARLEVDAKAVSALFS